MNIAYFDCFSGISGDMVLGAFLDLGLPPKLLRSSLSRMALPELRLMIKRGERQGLSGYTLQVKSRKLEGHARTYQTIKNLIEKSTLELTVKEDSLAILKRLGEVEGRIHGIELDKVHFHEIGALDTIVDIVGAALAKDYFKIKEVVSSPLPLGRGWIRSGHGPLPLPAPATLALLKGATIFPVDLDKELVTPTGAAILSHFAGSYGPPPAMVLKGIGYGLGQTQIPDRPNTLRIWLGEKTTGLKSEKLLVLETNIDDMNPQWYDHILDHLFQAGALDCLLIPCQMKKNRPAVLLQVLAQPESEAPLRDILLKETTTLGVRSYEVDRRSLPRTIESVRTPWGMVRIKKTIRPGHTSAGLSEDFTIEYDDLKKLAESQKKSLKAVESEVRGWLLKNGVRRPAARGR
jgi:uncharacterized protein (TIGR00299 family) protein